MIDNQTRIFKIKGSIKNYAWGKKGSSSVVAQFSKNTHQIDENLPYSELWFGTHPSGQSELIDESYKNLDDLIKSDPERHLGRDIADKFKELPFLFKILSIQTALSIQIHPDKESALKLHQISPDIYKDPNHKPEIVLALSTMTLMCGFRPYNQILHYLETVPELINIVGSENIENFKKSPNENNLKKIYSTIMKTDQDKINTNIELLMKRIENDNDFLSSTFKTIYRDFNKDVGLFSLFLFNLIQLYPGESIFLGPNVPHSYIYGDCIECMATSDNVIRAGLTPKFKDVDTLISLMDYSEKHIKAMKGEILNNNEDVCETVFNSPVDEFIIGYFDIPSNKSLKPNKSNGPIILLIYKGEGVIKDIEKGSSINIEEGTALFISANTEFEITSTGDMKIYKATTN